VPISPDTLLRILRSLAEDAQHQRDPRVLVDDVVSGATNDATARC
jgi:hypothetical protein